MRALLAKLHAFLKDEDGPTAVEYAVMLALIIAICMAAIGLTGNATSGSFSNANNRIIEAQTS